MKPSRKIKRKTKHRGGNLSGQQVAPATPPPETPQQVAPTTQAEPEKPWWKFWGGSRRRKLNKRKTSKRH